MKPATFTLELTENADNVYSFVISGITSAVGYVVESDIRIGPSPDAAALLQLSSPSSGMTLNSDGADLTIVMTITETQVDAMAVSLSTARCRWSLKLSAPGGTANQYLVGPVALTRTPTA